MTRFTIGDLHLGHEATCTKFKQSDGVTPLRPFANADEMDEEIIKRWNNVVGPYDKVYVLGDVVINKKHLYKVDRLNGKKRLIMGNHDLFVNDYATYFEEVHAYRVWDDMIMSHVPIHPDSLTQRFGTNVHGHLHANRVMTTRPARIDARYFCVSVEQINFTPISFEELRDQITQQQKDPGYEPRRRS